MHIQEQVTSPAAESGSLYIVAVSSVLHLVWAGLLVSSRAASFSTPVSGVLVVTGSRPAAVAALAGSAVLALAVSWLRHSRRREVSYWAVALGLIPQQFFLLVSAFSAVSAAVAGQYADGTPRTWQFIIGDQLPVILIALLYTTAILAVGPFPKLPKGSAT